jgi:hypothetical protein
MEPKLDGLNKKTPRESLTFTKDGVVENNYNQETAGTNQIEKEPKFKVLGSQELQQFVGEPLLGVINYVVTKYGQKVPNREDLQYLDSHPGKIPEFFKDGKGYYFLSGYADRGEFPGSAAQEVPCGKLINGELRMDAFKLTNRYNPEFDRFLVLE